MDAHVLDAGLLPYRAPVFLDPLKRGRSGCGRKHPGPVLSWPVPQELERDAGEGPNGLSGFALVEPQEALLKINLRPFQAGDLAASGAGQRQHPDDPYPHSGLAQPVPSVEDFPEPPCFVPREEPLALVTRLNLHAPAWIARDQLMILGVRKDTGEDPDRPRSRPRPARCIADATRLRLLLRSRPAGRDRVAKYFNVGLGHSREPFGAEHGPDMDFEPVDIHLDVGGRSRGTRSTVHGGSLSDPHVDRVIDAEFAAPLFRDLLDQVLGEGCLAEILRGAELCGRELEAGDLADGNPPLLRFPALADPVLDDPGLHPGGADADAEALGILIPKEIFGLADLRIIDNCGGQSDGDRLHGGPLEQIGSGRDVEARWKHRFQNVSQPWD